METILFAIGSFCTLFGFLITISAKIRGIVNRYGPDWIIRTYLILSRIGKVRYIFISLLFSVISIVFLFIIAIAEDEFPVEAFAIGLWSFLLFSLLLIASIMLYISKIQFEKGDKYVVRYAENKAPVDQIAVFLTLLGVEMLLISILLIVDTKFHNNLIHNVLEGYINLIISEL